MSIKYYQIMPIHQIMIEDVEADDVIAHVCHMESLANDMKIIVSADKDFFQLLDNNTILYRPIQKEVFFTGKRKGYEKDHPTLRAPPDFGTSSPKEGNAILRNYSCCTKPGLAFR